MGLIKDEMLVNEEPLTKQEPVAMLNDFVSGNTAPHIPKNMLITDTRIKLIGAFSSDISTIRRDLRDELFNAFLNTVITLIIDENLSRRSLIYDHIRVFKSYLKIANPKEITIKSLSLFLEKCRNHEISSQNFGMLKTLLTKWHSLSLPGVSDDIIDFIRTVKRPQPKRPAGSRIRSDDPTEGWYTDSEYDALVHAIWQAYESGSDTLWRTTALLLSAQFGRRPIQIANLKIGDLKSAGESCGVSGPRIEFPGAKDRHVGGFRQSKIEVHPVSDELWRLCQLQATESSLRFEKFFGLKLSTKENRLLPLFPTILAKTFAAKIEDSKYLYDTHSEILASPLLHTTAHMIVTVIRKGPRGAAIISERTGQPLIQNAYRFRYTRARQLARLGVPRAILQYWLGHETESSLDAYYDDPAERARVLNNQIAPLIAPLAQAFQGTLRDSEEITVRGNDPGSRIEVDGKEQLGVGTCGEHGFCTASVPIPCYRCTKFQPWVFGPHHEVLARLLNNRSEM